MDQAPDPEVRERPRLPRSYPAAYKLRILEEYEQLDKAGKGALLRREGLYTSLISEWRKQRDKGALAGLQQRRGRPPVDPRDRELARLERENARLRDQVARQAKVIEVQGELSALLGRLATSATTQPPRTRRAASRQADGGGGSGGGHLSAGGGDAARLPGRRPASLQLVSPLPPVPTPATLAAAGARTAAAGAPSRRAPAGPGRAPRRAVLRPGSGQRGRHSAGRGSYLCSTSTMYRLLRQQGETGDRRRHATHPPRVKPELLACRPNQCWSWDITKLAGPARWSWYYLYVILDIYSRYVVGWMVAAREAARLAERLLADTIAAQQVQPGKLNVHADRGTSMTSKPVAMLLADLGVTRSHSRPHVPDDNPYSESQFKTLKHHPAFPERFGSLQEARGFCQRFFGWYNHEHRHSGIALLTPPTSTSAERSRSPLREARC